jgi:hypothetical protein
MKIRLGSRRAHPGQRQRDKADGNNVRSKPAAGDRGSKLAEQHARWNAQRLARDEARQQKCSKGTETMRPIAISSATMPSTGLAARYSKESQIFVLPSSQWSVTAERRARK